MDSMGMSDIIENLLNAITLRINDKVKDKKKKFTRYKLAEILREMGVKVANPSKMKYSSTEEDASQGINLRVLAGILLVGRHFGISGEKQASWIIDEFLQDVNPANLNKIIDKIVDKFVKDRD